MCVCVCVLACNVWVWGCEGVDVGRWVGVSKREMNTRDRWRGRAFSDNCVCGSYGHTGRRLHLALTPGSNERYASFLYGSNRQKRLMGRESQGGQQACARTKKKTRRFKYSRTPLCGCKVCNQASKKKVVLSPSWIDCVRPTLEWTSERAEDAKTDHCSLAVHGRVLT